MKKKKDEKHMKKYKKIQKVWFQTSFASDIVG